jgi:hypothetical protein
MTTYSQRDSRWAGLRLGVSPYTMGGQGCLTTLQSIALWCAGWNFTPGDVCTGLSNNEGYTDNNYVQGPGLLNWYKVGNVFPMYHFHPDTSGDYQFIQVIGTWPHSDGTFYRGEHWILLHAGQYYDPLDGEVSSAMKTIYRPTGRIFSADIDINHITAKHSFDTDLYPDADYPGYSPQGGYAQAQPNRDEVGYLQSKLKELGLFPQHDDQGNPLATTPDNGYGYYGKHTLQAVGDFQKKYLGFSDATENLGYFGPRTRARINQ